VGEKLLLSLPPSRRVIAHRSSGEVTRFTGVSHVTRKLRNRVSSRCVDGQEQERMRVEKGGGPTRELAKISTQHDPCHPGT